MFALLADHERAPEAIAILRQMGDRATALPAALHLLIMRRGDVYGGPDPRWWVVESLMEYGYAQLGLAAARWMALRPDCSSRMEACEALLEAGQIESTIPLLQYLAFDSHGEAGQRACKRLLALRESARVQPLFLRAERKADSALRY
jgi:hypothetical protein